MAFQIKDFISISLSQINHARSVTDKITDFQPGSVARTIMEAPAVEIEELYLQMFTGLREAIPTATFLSFGFDRLPASFAHGWVSVSSPDPLNDPLTIPVGTEFSTADGRTYTSTAQVIWEDGEDMVRVPVVSATIGLVGNVAAGVINSSPLFPAPYTVSNAEISTGRDTETDAEREARFAEFIQALSRGTVTACMYAARNARVLDENGNIFEYVTRAGIDEEPGYVRIYVYSSVGIPTDELLAHGQLLLDGTRDDEAGTITPGFRSAGVRVDLLPMTERSVPLSIQVGMFTGYTLTSEVEQQISDIFASSIASILPGATLYLGTLIEAMLVVPGVRTIVPTSNQNIICGVFETLIPGQLTITAL